MKTEKVPGPVGRPREFDPEVALDQALLVFWKKGYEGTSLSDLTGAMGINRPSLYSAFGNKESLFRKALDRYAAMKVAYLSEALNLPTAREVAHALLKGAAATLSDPTSPRGCLAVQSALACGAEADPVRLELIARRKASEASVRERLERAKAEGDLPATADPAVLAGYLMVVIQGMCVRSAGGTTGEEMAAIVETTMASWPS